MPSDAEILEALRQGVFDLATKKVKRVTIGQTSFEFQDLPMLENLKAKYENAASRATYGDQALISLTGPGR